MKKCPGIGKHPLIRFGIVMLLKEGDQALGCLLLRTGDAIFPFDDSDAGGHHHQDHGEQNQPVSHVLVFYGFRTSPPAPPLEREG